MLWRLEKGERVGVLDTLATSTSLTSAVTSQFQLRQISVLGIVLVATWALSPIGGQASIRQMTIDGTVVTTPASFQAAVPNGYLSTYISSDNHNTFLTINTLFIGAIIASSKTKASPLDIWGNVKIPKIERYEKIYKPDNDGWYTINTNDDDLAAYPSFVGIPMNGNKDNITTTDYNFYAHTPYLQLQCTAINRTWSAIGNPIRPSMPKGGQNVTGNNGFIWWSLNETQSRYKDSLEALRPFNFSYAPTYSPFSLLPCAMTTTYEEAEVSCAVNSTCRATKVRRSQLNQFPPAFTMMDTHWQNWAVFLKGFMSSLGEQKGSGSLNIFDKYLADPSLPIENGFVQDMFDYPLASNEAYSDRFGQLLNSYFACLNGISTITGGINNDTSYFWDTNITFVPPKLADGPNSQGRWMNYNWTGDSNRRSRVWPSEGSKHVHIEVINAHKPWTTTLSIISLLLIACSLISPLVRSFLTKGPDVAMNFSSLAIRNNAFVPVPSSGTYLDAAHRFKLLRNVRLRFGDAEGKADTGSLVIGAYGGGEEWIGRVRKGRVYE